MVKNQDFTAVKRFFLATAFVFLLSAANSFAQHEDHGDHSDESHQVESNDHSSGSHTDESGHHDSSDNQHHGEEVDHSAHAESGGHHDSGHAEEEFNAGDMMMHHIKDDHVWEFFEGGTIYLPVLLYTSDRGFEMFSSKHFYGDSHTPHEVYNGYELHHGKISISHGSGRDDVSLYDFSITKNTASLFFAIGFLLIIFFSVGRQYRSGKLGAPKGLAAVFEPVVVYVRDEIAKPNIGPKYEKFMPFLLTLFFFIWVNNLFGLTPGAANLTGNIAVTLTLAVFTFIVVNINGNKHYWKHIFATPGVPKPVLLILVPVEFLGLFTKPFSLMIRLFVAISAGHIVILSLIALAFIFQSYVVAGASMILVTFINLIELLVATIQAYVFTMFTALYIGQAVADDHH